MRAFEQMYKLTVPKKIQLGWAEGKDARQGAEGQTQTSFSVSRTTLLDMLKKTVT